MVIKHSGELRAAMGYEIRRCREALRKRDTESRISRRGIKSGEPLGRHRWWSSGGPTSIKRSSSGDAY